MEGQNWFSWYQDHWWVGFVAIGAFAIASEAVKSAAHRAKDANTRIERTGLVLGWLCTGVAVAIATAGLVAIYFDGESGVQIAVVAGVPAALVWLLGKALRFILIGPSREEATPKAEQAK